MRSGTTNAVCVSKGLALLRLSDGCRDARDHVALVGRTLRPLALLSTVGTLLTELERLRKSLSTAHAEEAVEAALYAMDAAQGLEGMMLEKRASVGEKVIANLSRAGQLRAAMVARKNAKRDADIRHRAKQMKKYDGASDGEIARALADRFRLSARQIRRILAKVDTS